MQIIKQSWEYITKPNGEDILKNIETIGRTCYKSHDLNPNGDMEKTKRFVKNIVDRKHESVLECQTIQLRLFTDRAILAEITRHRSGISFAVESQRYCCYSKDKFGGDITFILPTYLYNIGKDDIKYQLWHDSCLMAEQSYLKSLTLGCKPEEARSVLPNSTKCEIALTVNIRELRHIMKLRTDYAAHPMMRELMKDILETLKKDVPILFDDL